MQDQIVLIDLKTKKIFSIYQEGLEIQIIF